MLPSDTQRGRMPPPQSNDMDAAQGRFRTFVTAFALADPLDADAAFQDLLILRGMIRSAAQEQLPPPQLPYPRRAERDQRVRGTLLIQLAVLMQAYWKGDDNAPEGSNWRTLQDAPVDDPILGEAFNLPYPAWQGFVIDGEDA